MIACLAGPVATSSLPLFSMAAMPDTIMPDAICSGAITMQVHHAHHLTMHSVDARAEHRSPVVQ